MEVNNNVRSFSILLGIGLIVLWIAGLNSVDAPGWLVWLDGIAGLCAFAIAGGMRPTTMRGAVTNGQILLGAALMALWIAGLATGTVAWLTWWTFAFACAFLILGFSGRAGARRALPASELERERERFRRSA